MNDEPNDAIVRGAARLFYGTDTIFKDLELGDRFTFPTNAVGTVCTKTTNNGWYVMHGTGRTFRTGTRTAVVRLPAMNDDELTQAIADAMNARGFKGCYGEHTGGGIFCIFVPTPTLFFVIGMADINWAGCGFTSRGAYENGEESVTCLEVQTDVPSDNRDVNRIADALSASINAVRASVPCV